MEKGRCDTAVGGRRDAAEYNGRWRCPGQAVGILLIPVTICLWELRGYLAT